MSNALSELTAAAPAELAIAGAERPGFEKARVLLVDDSRLIRMGLRRSLESIGLQNIVEANHGREAIEMLVRERYDLMLLDMEKIGRAHV